MKKFILPLLILSATFLFSSCKDYNSHSLTAVDTGTADFSKYVAVGNSLTAGYSNGALYQEAQKYSYPNLIARQLHIKDFEQPLVSSPGIGNRLEVNNFETFSITANTQMGTPLNATLDRPYDNLGIPGAVLVDYSNDNDQGQLKERATNTNRLDFNPFYQLIMRTELQKAAPNINDLVTALNPTFVTFWLGNNDALGYVLDGGAGRSLLPPATFQALMQRAGQLLGALPKAKVAIMNIPNVTDIPFVFQTNAQLQQEGMIKLDSLNQYQLVTQQGDLNIYIKTKDTTRVMMKNDFLLLTAQQYLATADPTKGALITPQGAIPSQYVLDGPAGGQPGSSELEQAIGAVAQYNAAINAVVQANPDKFMLVNINGFFSRIITNYQTKGYGELADGDTLNPVIGSIFGLDGIHPTSKGYALVANEIIDAVNSKYNAKIPDVDVRQIPLGLPWAK